MRPPESDFINCQLIDDFDDLIAANKYGKIWLKNALNSTQPKLILAVDDEEPLCVLTKEFLEISGALEVDIAGSVSEARVAIAQRRYDAIVSDYQMPGEDGIQFLKSLRASGDTIPFILIHRQRQGRGRHRSDQ